MGNQYDDCFLNSYFNNNDVTVECNKNAVSSTELEDVSDDDLDIGIGPLIDQDTEIDELLKIVLDWRDHLKQSNKRRNILYYFR